MTTTTLSWDVVPVDKPDDVNVVIGQAHFIKTVEDLHEAMVGVSSSLRFGLAFCEASGPRLVRRTGNDPELVELGGDPNDARNLWVEPGESPNRKDGIEHKLHSRVCAGKVPLAAAQEAIARDWTTALN